jgi:hypothetical protein
MRASLDFFLSNSVNQKCIFKIICELRSLSNKAGGKAPLYTVKVKSTTQAIHHFLENVSLSLVLSPTAHSFPPPVVT